MAGEKFKLFEADIDVDGIINKSVELKQEMTKLRLEQQKLKATVGETSEEWIKSEARLKKLSAEYNLNQKQVSNLSTTSKEFLTVEQKLTMALEKEIVTISAATKNNEELKKIRNEVNASTAEGKKVIDEINKKIDENTNFIKANVSELENQKISIGDYKNQIKDAYNELNIMNGGLLGFIGRAEQAGGVGNLLTKSIKGITTGIMGMTKASLAFIASPIGAVIVVIGLVLGALITYLKSTQEGIDKITAVTRPLTAVFQTLIGVIQDVGKFLFEAFSNPKKTLTDLYEFVKGQLTRSFQSFGKILEGLATFNLSKIKEGFSDLGDQATDNLNMVVGAASGLADRLAEAYERGQKIDMLMKQLAKGEAEFITSQAEYLKNFELQKKFSEDTTKSLAERQAAAETALGILKQSNDEQRKRLGLELEILKLKQEDKSLTDADRVALAQKNAEITKSIEELYSKEVEVQNNRNALIKEANDKAKAAAQKAFDDSIKKQEIALRMFIISEGEKARTLSEQLELAEKISLKEIEIERRKYEAKRITKEEFDLFVRESELELSKIRMDLANEEFEQELQMFKDQHQSKIEANKFLNEILYQQEKERIDKIADAERESLQKRFEAGIINATEYNDALRVIDEENTAQINDLNTQREEAQKEKEAIDLANQREIDAEKMQYDLDMQLKDLELRKQQEIESAEKTGADIALIEEKYAALRKRTEETVQGSKLSLYSNAAGQIAGIVGKQSALGKAAALSQVAIDTYTSATAAFKSLAGIPIVGPALGAIAAAAAIVSGLSNAKKIASEKLPRAERGMAFDIKGRRHSSGGTKFYGEDGSGFEAERGEKLFVLNRQASAAIGPLLSDINQQYGGVSLGRSSTYLAAGGQVLRSVPGAGIDMDKLAAVVSDSVREGAAEGSRQGSMEGSSRGTYSGIVDREDYVAIAAGANF